MPNYPINHGGPENGGARGFLSLCRSGALHWDWTPEFMWQARIGYRDLAGPAATQRATITIPTADFVTGRLTVTISGGGLSSPVVATADAAVGDTEDDLGVLTASTVDALAATTLAGVITGADVDAGGDNVVHIDFVAGIARATVAVAFAPAQQTTATFGGTLLDGAYGLRFECDAPNADTTATVSRAAAVPVDGPAMAVAMEAAAEALIAGDLAGILVSADDAGAVNTLVFEPGVTVVVTSSVPPGTTLTFGGTETDGNYDTIVTHSSIPGGSATLRTTRVGAVPLTNILLAVDHEAVIEADPRVASLIASADDDGAGVNTVLGFPLVTGMTFATAAPAPGTLTSSPPTLVIADATPAGPVVTVGYSVTLALNTLAIGGAFPNHVTRLNVALEVVTAFGATRTITVGDAGDPDGLLGSTPVTLNSTGRTLSIAADAEHEDRYEGTQGAGGRLVPTATIDLGTSNAPTQGLAFVQIDWAPHPSCTVR